MQTLPKEKLLLADFVYGRDNNLHLIRILAAYAVLVSHSFVLATGDGANEPFARSLGVTVGAIAVDVFFIASGLLVTGSLLVKQDLREFAWARARRIFPALFVMLVLVVFVMGPTLTRMPLSAYFADGATYQYLLKSATLVTGMGKSLPGLFEHNPFPQAVNGSLWTLKFEIRMYVILGLMWLLIRVLLKMPDGVFKAIVLLVAGLAGFMHLKACLGFGAYSQSVHLFFMFFMGASIYLLKDQITLSWPIFAIVAVGILAAATSRTLFPVAYTMAIPYLLVFLAYVPAGRIRAYNTVGDYSYGTYIYAFPVQQALASCFPGIGVWAMTIMASGIVLPLAMLSWHFVEKPMLSRRRYSSCS
ncbi:MAG: acyltransferase [Aquabacterium sp.]|nr:acyltransferase [Aquabacterium sp.]